MNNITIPRRQHTCSACQAPLTHDSLYYSRLQWNDDQPAREDFCHQCWQSTTTKGCFWKGTVLAQDDTKKQARLTQNEEAIQQLHDALLSQYHHDAFILALYLERRKILALRQEISRSSHTIRIYEHPPSGIPSQFSWRTLPSKPPTKGSEAI